MYMIDMDENAAAKQLLCVHEDGRELEIVFSEYLLSRRFGKIIDTEPKKWLKGKIPKQWTLVVVIPVMWQ